MSVNKFKKHRSVDKNYLNIPYKYIVGKGFKGGSNNYQKDKDLCIVDFFGKNFVTVGWRSSNSCSISMPKLCRVVTKNGKKYFVYRGRKVLFSDSSGWVF